MNSFKLFTTIILAGSVLSTPALSAQKRKTLFDVLFPKAHEQRVKREQERLRAEQLRNAKPVKVATSRYYTYKTVARSPIVVKPIEVELASVGSVEVSTESEVTIENQTPIASVETSLMTNDLLAAGKLGLSTDTHIAKAVSAFYSDNQDYFWIDETGEWNSRARSVMKVLENAESYGLVADDYAVNVGAKPEETVETAEVDGTEADKDLQDAKFRLMRELAMTSAATRYAMDAKFGTINPNRLSGYHDFPVHYGKTADIVEDILGPGLPANALRAMHPSHEKFEALRIELAALSNVEDDVIVLPTKILIKPGNTNENLPNFIKAIQKRASKETLDAHAEFLSAYQDGQTYTKEAAALVKAYQKEAGLGADGVIGRNTATKLAGLKSEDKKMQVKLAMERLRWLPHELGTRHVFINQPEYRARYMESGEEKLSMRVVVGKRSNQTNFFYDEIEKVVYNPYWGVPRSIIVNEFRAKSLGNPAYLDSLGYEVTNASGRRVSASNINWAEVGTHPNFNVRQPPGRKNALGEVKILFPNKHAIYMHDTPSKHLFKRENRAFSHGCVRLHDPWGMAAAVLGKSKSHVKGNIATGKNQTEHLTEKVPVYVSYFTAWPQADGSVKYFRDMYGRDAHLIKAMNATRKARSTNIAS